MAIRPVSEPTRALPPLALWSVGLAGVSTAMIALALAGLGGAGGGMMLSLVAFILAITLKVRHVRWTPLWLPLLLFPVLVVTAPLWV